MNVNNNTPVAAEGRRCSAVCTLFEGDYHYGVAALVNSLYRVGFRGTVWAGYRGVLPFWANVDAQGRMAVGDGLALQFVPLSTPWHLTNYKAKFMRELWDREGQAWSSLFYFDPDIVVRAKWTEFEHWASCGVAMVEDAMNGRIGPTHPLRARWCTFAKQQGYAPPARDGDVFCNGGYVGVSRNNRAFLPLWESLIERVFAAYELDPAVFMHYAHGRSFPFVSVDQDTLNLAAMLFEGPLSVVGPEGMDFNYGGYFMAHAIASPKPWRKGSVRSALRGVPPSSAIKTFWAHVEKPIRVFGATTVRLSKLRIAAATLIGRFYRRA